MKTNNGFAYIVTRDMKRARGEFDMPRIGAELSPFFGYLEVTIDVPTHQQPKQEEV